MRFSELKGKSVVSVTGARKLGKVEDALVRSVQDSIAALRVRTEQKGPGYVVADEHIRAIGRDAVTIDSQDSLRMPGEVPNLTGLMSLASIIDSRVVTEGGEVLGTITDVEFDPTIRKVISLEYDGGLLGALLKRRHMLSPKEVISIGGGIVTVSEAARPSRAA